MPIDTSQLDNYAVRLSNVPSSAASKIKQALTAIGIYLVGYVKTKKLSGNPINRRSGNLSRHIDYMVESNGNTQTLRVGVVRGASDVPYAPYLEYGTKPHIITVVNKKVLANKQGEIFGRVVHHPGNRAYHYMHDTLVENYDYITKNLRAAAAEPLKG